MLSSTLNTVPLSIMNLLAVSLKVTLVVGLEAAPVLIKIELSPAAEPPELWRDSK
jgi:hypothetical protein